MNFNYLLNILSLPAKQQRICKDSNFSQHCKAKLPFFSNQSDRCDRFACPTERVGLAASKSAKINPKIKQICIILKKIF